MGFELIVAEKPSVARDIARVVGARARKEGYFEGGGWRVSWCIGHVASLAEPASYNPDWKRWRLDDLPMLPKRFEVAARDGAKKQLAVLARLVRARDVSGVVNACDAGREGELIFRYMYELCGGRKPVRRLWLASMTDEAIGRAMDRLRPASDYDRLGAAARCRAEADWLIGMNATRALTLRARRARPAAKGRAKKGADLMSVGRVQTPTLAMIVERERAIESFVPQTFWQVRALFDAGPQDDNGPRTFEALWTRKRGGDRTSERAEAERVAAEAEAIGAGIIAKTDRREKRERPPLLFDLTSLQREASRRWGMRAKDTLAAAQSLYERHKLITYPRTDSNYLTADQRSKLPGVVDALKSSPLATWAEPLRGAKLRSTKRIINDAEVGDHHAIIPTTKPADPLRLSEPERRVWELVARRFLAAFYPDAIFAVAKIAVAVGPHAFVASGRVRLEAGWQAVYPIKREAKKGSAPPPALPLVESGDEVAIAEVAPRSGQTKPPKRFTDGGILGAMERAGAELDDEACKRAMKGSGLGTPATRAAILETLLKRKYIARRNKVLVPTETGRQLIDAIGPAEAIKSAELTGRWEAKLAAIERGEEERDAFMEAARAYAKELVRDLGQSGPPPARPSGAPRPGDRCPACEEGSIIAGRERLGCSRWRAGCSWRGAELEARAS